MSELKVDKITPRQGTTLTLGDSGDTINFGSGVLPNFENLTVTGDLTVDTNSLKVDSTNNRVGIGTASPSTTLHLAQSLPQIRLEDTDTGAYGTISGQSTAGSLFIRADDGNTVANSVLGFSVDNDQKMTIEGSGNVGIGTTSPNRPLEIYNGDPYIRLTDSVAPTGYSELRGTHLGALVLAADASNSVSGSYQAFEVDGSERVRIDSSGNVGIGTSSPNGKLDVSLGSNEKVRFGEIDIFKTISGAGTNEALIQKVSTGSNLVIGSPESIYMAIDTDNNQTNRGFIVQKDSNIAGGGTELFKIDESGNVGIGTSSPDHNLTVDATTGSYSTSGINLKRTGILTGDADIRLGGSSGSEALIFNVNDSQKMRVQSDGKVGIGTTNPSRTLHVNSGSSLPVARFETTGTVGYIHLKDATGSGSIGSNDGDGLRFFTGDAQSEHMRIDGSGNVGIGTSSPSRKLTVTGGEVEIRDGNYFMMRPSGNAWDMRLQAVSTRLDVVSGGDTANPIATFVHGGNVGIGETSPLGKLHIKTADVSLSPSSNADELVIEGTGNVGITIGANGSGTSNIFFADTGDNNVGEIQYAHSTDHLAFNVNAGEKMRIDSSGRVGIGTSSPDSRLEVLDSSATGIISRSTSTQATDTNKAIRVRNNSDTNTFSVSYKGLVTATAFSGDGSSLTGISATGVTASSYGSSNKSNGYVRFTDGLIIQWGWVSSSGGWGHKTVTLPLTFPNYVDSITTALDHGSGYRTNDHAMAQIISSSQIKIGIDDTTTTGTFWMVIGH